MFSQGEYDDILVTGVPGALRLFYRQIEAGGGAQVGRQHFTDFGVVGDDTGAGIERELSGLALELLGLREKCNFRHGDFVLLVIQFS